MDFQKDFPILNSSVNGNPLIYFDNAATSQKPKCVIKALSNYYESINSNVHRGVHELSQKATSEYEETRNIVGDFIGSETSRTNHFHKRHYRWNKYCCKCLGRKSIAKRR